jgi:Phosphotransferase enzyme family
MPPAPLRQADWRFLLPNPDGDAWNHVVLLGGSAKLAGLLTGIGAARRVSRTIPAERCADAVVVLGARVRDVRSAASCLTPSGVLYAEVPGWRPTARRRAARVSRMLRKLGLEQVRTYGIRVDASRRGPYVPIDVEEPGAWLEESLSAGRSTRRSGNFRLDVAVTAAAGTDEPPSVLGHRLLGGRWRAGGTHLIMLTGGDVTDAQRRVVLLPFGSGAKEPELVVKFWRSAERNADTTGEQEILRALRPEPGAPAARAVPEPLGSFPWGSVEIGVEGYCPGRSFSAMNARRGASPDEKVTTLRRVLAGLAELGASTVIRREPWSSGAMRGRMEAVLARFEEEFPTGEDERRLFEAVRRQSNALSSASLAVVWSHPDLGPSNVLVRSEGITVIDWAKASPGLPLQDVLYLLLIASADISGARRESQRREAFRRVFLMESPGDELGAAAREGIELCLEALGADRRFLPILLVFLWVNR